MARNKQLATATVTTASSFPAAEAVDIAQLVEDLDGMLSRLSCVNQVDVWRQSG